MKYSMKLLKSFLSLIFLLTLVSVVSAGEPQTTAVLVHGAFADGSSWSRVIPILEAKGLKVVAVQNPLSSLADDVAATRRAIDQQTGPVVLVGHSWAGVVITEAANDSKVKALVYVAAFAPDNGQSINDLLKGFPAPKWTSELQKDSGGFLRLSTDAIIHDFAQDVSVKEARLIAATQGSWFSGCADEKVDHAAWHEKPSWFIVTEKDQMINPGLQETMAKNIKATVIKANASHVVMVSQPEKTASAIIEAGDSLK
jgi:pimeloyl-ACP methyl ester carboxylesterase